MGDDTYELVVKFCGRTWKRLRILTWRGICWARKTHRIQVTAYKPSPIRTPGGTGRRIAQGVCIHCGYSMEADLTPFQIPALLDENTDTLKLGSRAKVPFKKRCAWLWADLKRVQ